jgi:hypothetical protein
MLCKRIRLQLTICVICWKMALNLGLEVSLDNIQVWKGIRGKAEEVNSAKAHITHDETPRRIINGCYTCILLRNVLMTSNFPFVRAPCKNPNVHVKRYASNLLTFCSTLVREGASQTQFSVKCDQQRLRPLSFVSLVIAAMTS